ncbi:MAG: Mur ligase family protein, partial [Acidimicrobiia bacterium]
MLLSDVAAAVSVLELRGNPQVEVTAVTHDSRRVVRGALFCCVPGSATDGHDHAAAAVAAGAGALLVERFLDLGDARVAQVRVASTREAMAPAAAAVYGDPSRRLAVLGVTGTNGKTTVTFLLEGMARAAGRLPGVIGTVGARLGGAAFAGLGHTTPEAPDFQALLGRMADAGAEVVAVEASSHALALHRVDATWFTAACFTNLSHDHLDFHGDLDGYFAAK